MLCSSLPRTGFGKPPRQEKVTTTMPNEIKTDSICNDSAPFTRGFGLPQPAQIPAPPQTVIDNIVKPTGPSVAPAPVPDKES